MSLTYKEFTVILMTVTTIHAYYNNDSSLYATKINDLPLLLIIDWLVVVSGRVGGPPAISLSTMSNIACSNVPLSIEWGLPVIVGRYGAR